VLRRAALDLFSKRGYDATSVSDIAAAAGVTERTFFRHFPTKDAVLFYRSQERFDVLGKALADHIEIAHPTWDGIAAALEQFAFDIEDDVERLDQVAQTVVGAPGLAPRRREHRSLWEERAAEVLSRDGGDGNAVFVANLIITAVNRGQEIWVRSGGGMTLAEAMSHALAEARSALPANDRR
jgi:AcrR family transcriptional regulator